MVEQLNRHARLVLLGDPGSGKSTFVNFVALCLAGEALGSKTANLALLTTPLPPEQEDRLSRDPEEPTPQPWDNGALMPVRVILRDFAARGPAAGRESCHCRAPVGLHRPRIGSGFAGRLSSPVRAELLKKGGLLLLDGLDEVPEAGRRRQQLKQAVENFAATYGQCRILVTSRTYAYQRQDWRLKDFTTRAGALQQARSPLHRPLVCAHRRSARPEPCGCPGPGGLLKRAILGSERLLGLAERPLLLTLMASLTPGAAAACRKSASSSTPTRWTCCSTGGRAPVGARRSGRVVAHPAQSGGTSTAGREPIRAPAQPPGLQAHRRQPALTGAADSLRSDRSRAARTQPNPEGQTALLLDYLSHRAGLLIPRGVNVYAFPHRTFQEYLAACHLTGEEFFPDKVAELARHRIPTAGAR